MRKGADWKEYLFPKLYHVSDWKFQTFLNLGPVIS